MKEEKTLKNSLNLPYSLELEQAILGCMLINSQTRLQLLDELSKDDFYLTEHQNIFEALQLFSKEHQEDKEGGVLSFLIFLENKKLTETCRSKSYINSLTELCPDILNIEVYLNMLKSLTMRRRAINQAIETIKQAQDQNRDIATSVDMSISSFIDISSKKANSQGCIKGTRVVSELEKTIEKYGLEMPSTTLIPSGFSEIDRKIGGFRPSQLTIIGARPSVGKTAFSLSLVLNMLINPITAVKENENGELIEERKKVKIGYYSLEMPKEDIVTRILSSLTCINLSYINGTRKTNDERIVKSIKRGLGILEKTLDNFFIYDSSKMDIGTLRGSIRALKSKEDIDIIFIDYLQLIDTSKSRARELWERVQETSLSLKNLARELKIPIVCLSQLNREAEGSRPTLATLRNSGAIEQDADLIIFLHDQEKEKKDRNYKKVIYKIGKCYYDCEEARPIDVIIAKQRNGEIGDTQLLFLSDFVRFAEYQSCNVKNEVADD